MDKNTVNQIYFSMADSKSVPRATEEILKVIKSRHRPESEYLVSNLTQVLEVAQKFASTLTLVLGLFATVTLIVGGIGIMNIMFATVSFRIREIGIRKAVGATRLDITLQFLTEAILISVTGAGVGTLIGLGLPCPCGLLAITNCRFRFSARLSQLWFAARWELRSAPFPPSGQRRWIRWSASSSTSLPATQ